MNKFSKYAGLLAVSFFGMFAMNSCDDSKDNGDFSVYDGQTPDVYFPTSTTQIITAGETTRDFDFNVYRASTDGPTTVSLSWSGDVALFTLPTSATFDANSVIAPVTVEFVSQDLTPLAPYNLTVTIEGTEMSELTQNYLSFQVTYYPMSEWAPFGYDESLGRNGEGYYVFSQYYAGTENPVRVMYSYSLVDSKQMQFEFQWLEDYDDPDSWETFLTAESSDGGNNIVVPEQPFASHSTYGTVYVSTASLYNPVASSGPSYFDSETGTFYLDLIYYVSEGYFGYGYETCTLNGYMDTNDYTVTLSNNGSITLNDENYQIVNFSWTEAVQMVLYTAVETSSISEDGEISQELLEDLAEQMMNGDVEASLAEDQGNLTFSFESSGNYTVVALGIAADQSTGEYVYKTIATLSFSYTSPDPNEGWNILGMVQYTDGYMCSLFNGVEPLTYSVEIQENQETPGLYRLVNPYGEAYPYNEPGDWNPKVNSYLVINAEDPDGVYILESPQTLDWGYGAMSCFSMAGNYIVNGGYPVDVVKDAGYCGTLSDGKITFPASTLLVTMADLGGWYYANAYGDDEEATFCVDLNTLTSATSAKAKSKSAKVSKGSIKVKGAKKAETFKSKAKVANYSSKQMNVNKKRQTFRRVLSQQAI